MTGEDLGNIPSVLEKTKFEYSPLGISLSAFYYIGYIYYIGYVTVKKNSNCININSVNPLYLMINEMIDHFGEKNENKYLVSDDVDENKEVSKKNEEVWESVKEEIETINGGKKVEYGKKN